MGQNPFKDWNEDRAAEFNRKTEAGRRARSRFAEPGGQLAPQPERQPQISEDRLHDQIIAYCNSQWPRWKFIHARMDQKSTVAVGSQDFTIFAPGRVICIECKRVGGKLSKEQAAWAKEMEMLGWPVYVAHSLQEFLAIAEAKT